MSKPAGLFRPALALKETTQRKKDQDSSSLTALNPPINFFSKSFTMKPSSIITALTALTERKRPVFIWGAPGVGKSDVVQAVADKRNVELRDVRLSLMDPTDIKGFPHITETKSGKTMVKQMAWVPPNFLPIDGNGILFLDELVSAPRAVQAAAYQLILNRRVGDYELPPGWSIVAAGNRTGDRAVVHEMPSPLANRFVHIDFDVDMEDWYAWATANKISNVVRSFIRFKPKALHSFNPESNERAFPTPRSWVFVDDVVSNGKYTPDVELELIKGTVGEGAAAEFIAHMRMAKDLPTADEILMSPETAPVPGSPASKYAVCSSLDSVASKATWTRLMKYMSRMEPEYQVLFARSAVQACRDIASSQDYIKWITSNRELIQ